MESHLEAPFHINFTSFNRSPDCSAAVASEAVLVPPNHEYRPISILGVTDPDGDPVTITVTSVTQDEPANGRGDGATCPDAQIAEGQAAVRAERSGSGDGRVYAIHFTAADGRGGHSDGAVTVCVPHDESDVTCVDGGQEYNSLGPCAGATKLAAESVSLGISQVAGSQAKLTFVLTTDAQVDISVYDVAGRRLATIESAALSSGVYQRVWNMNGVSKGLYFVRMHAGGVTLAKTVVKVR